MSTEYKVWVSVERIKEYDGDEQYDDMGAPDCLGGFDTFKQACAFVRSLPGGTSTDPGRAITGR